MGQSAQDSRRWEQAVKAISRVTPWLAFRWLFAQSYNSHQPQPCQRATKALAGQVAAEIVEGLGGSIMAPPDTSLDTDEDWLAWVKVAGRLDYDQRSSFMAYIMVQRWPHPHLLCTCSTDRWDRKRVQLSLLLKDLQVQQRANDAGWIAGRGLPKRRKSSRR